MLGKYVIFAIPTCSLSNYVSHLILNDEHLTFHLQYKKSGTFANCKYEELSYPKNPKTCDPILETILKMRPHYNQPSPENATPL